LLIIHYQVYDNVQDSNGRWSVRDSKGAVVANGRFEQVDNTYYNVQDNNGSWTVRNKSMSIVANGRAYTVDGLRYNVQDNTGKWTVRNSRMQIVSNGRVESSSRPESYSTRNTQQSSRSESYTSENSRQSSDRNQPVPIQATPRSYRLRPGYYNTSNNFYHVFIAQSESALYNYEYYEVSRGEWRYKWEGTIDFRGSTDGKGRINMFRTSQRAEWIDNETFKWDGTTYRWYSIKQ
jgi:hypothetical protein